MISMFISFNRPWYVATASPFPKDVVIVIDNSNGMGDSKLGGELLSDVAKEAAGIALDTLNGKDRVSLLKPSFECVLGSCLK